MEWQPVETAKNEETLLFYEPSHELFPGYELGPYYCVGYMIEGRFQIADVGGFECDVEMKKPTHWMPLPAPP
jgi:hypothetical protein